MAGMANPKIPSLNIQMRRTNSPQVLTIVNGGIPYWDVSYYTNARILANASFSIPTPTGLCPGLGGMLTIIQDQTGSRSIVWGTNYRGSLGAKPVLSTTANAVDQIAWYSPDGKYVDLSMIPAES